MSKKSTIAFAVFLLLLSTAFAQGRGGRHGQQQTQGQGQKQGQGPGWRQGQGSAQSGSTQMEQKRIRATTHQRDQIRSCSKLADGIRKQARKMAQTREGKFNADQALQQRNQIRDQIRSMDQEHERLMNGFDATQKQAWQEQIKNTAQLRQQLNAQMQQMDTEFNSANPDTKRVAERAREIEQTMNNLRTQYGVLSSQAGS